MIKQLSSYVNEDAIDLLADIFEPASKILSNPDLRKAIEAKENKMNLIKIAMKANKSEIIEVLAILHQQNVEEFECNIFSITQDLVDILNDKDLIDFFQSQGQMMAIESSISVTATTEAREK